MGVSDVGRPRTDYTQCSYDGNAGFSTFERIYMRNMIYAHTPPYDNGDDRYEEYSEVHHPINETVEFERYSHGVTMKDACDVGVVDYKFNEGNLIQEFKEYIDSTYSSHYGQGGLQSAEVIIDRGHGMGFFSGNVDKYNDRYGKKGTPADHRKDVLKIIHYGFFMLFEHDRVNGVENS